jgi:VanZ family protein
MWTKWFSRLIALAWTGMVVALLLKPNGAPASGPPIFSFRLASNDLWELPGHAIFFGVMAYLWLQVFAQSHSRQTAFLVAAGLAALIGVATEAVQYVVGRDALLLDLMADLAGIGFVGLVHLGTAALTKWAFRFAALAWTGLVVYVLLRPGGTPASGSLPLLFEPTLGALWEGVGILAFFAVLPYLWQRVFAQFYGRRPALLIAVCLGVLIGAAAEIGRVFGGRDMLLVDMAAGFIGISLFLLAHFAMAALAGLDSDSSVPHDTLTEPLTSSPGTHPGGDRRLTFPQHGIIDRRYLVCRHKPTDGR